MLASMTGFGEARRQIAGLSVLVEVRTINNRHFKLSFRASDGYAGLEPDVEAVVRDIVRRGTVQVNLRVDRQASSEDYRINFTVLESYRSQLDAYLQRYSANNTVGLETLLQLPGVVDPASRTNLDPRDDWRMIEEVLRDALAAVVKMRADEGAALLADLAANGRVVEQFLDKATARAPEVSESYRERLAQRVNKALAELNVTLQPADLIREVSLFVDRSDVSEETVRLRSHLQQYAEALNLAESSGRKLEFIVQEMGREVNTIGSKANDAEISRYVIEMKSALERIREQIQNVE
ncbi:MAG TPA: YicC/YloC family endoribonuclease [Lacipirellulaceae bacterium]